MRSSALALALALGAGSLSPLAAQEFPPPLAERLRAEVKPKVEAGEVEGVIQLVSIGGEVKYFEATGFADVAARAPLKTDAIVRIYSMSKPLTSVAAMTLYEQGKFRLDDPVSKYIPAFKDAKVLEGRGAEAKLVAPKRPITVRDVMRHTTGYSYGTEDAVKKYYADEKLLFGGPASMYPPDMTIERAADALARIPALHHPGDRFTYGFNTDLLGRLVEIWSGKSLDRYLKEAVFEPLRMVDTGFSVPKEKRHRLAACHGTKDGKLVVLDPADKSPFNDGFPFLSGGGGLLSTASDYANFCQMLVDGGTFKGKRVLEAETVKLMFTDQLKPGPIPFRFGLGFSIADVKLGADKTRRTAPEFSWGGYASTDFRVVPDEKMFQIVLRQYVPRTDALNNRLLGLVNSGLPPKPAPDKPAPAERPAEPKTPPPGVPAGLRNRFALAAPALVSATPAGRAEDWPQFRGSGGVGVVAGTVVPPAVWGTTENVAWKAELDGLGWSCPIVTGGKVFVTSCVGPEKKAAPKTGYYAPFDAKKLDGEHRWVVYCLDAATGKVLWEKVAHKGVPQHPIHVKASYASETPVTDGERVYAYFGNVGLYCYDLTGKQLWSKAWDVVPTQFNWGTGASPVLHKGRLYVINDNEKKSFLAALDARTGKEIWTVERDEKSNWATPFVWESGKRTEIVTVGKGKVRSYDLDGKLLWELGGMSSICVPAPVAGHGLLYVSSGYEFGRPRPVLAVKPGAAGDISLKKGETSNEYVAWYKEPAGAYHPTPLVLGDHLYVLYSTGFLSCFEARTGKVVYERERLGGSYTASPWSYDGKIFCLSEEGTTSVVRAGAEFELLGKNVLGEVALATPAVADGRLFVRTTGGLYCVAKPVEKK